MRRYRTPYGDELRWVTGEEETGGAYCLLERIAPPGARSTPHIHSQLTEAFYVLGGSFGFAIGGAMIVGTPGVFAQAGPGVEHSWRVTSSESAKALVLFTPSVRKAYFEELDAIVSLGPPFDATELQALSEKYGWT
jgi:quercetin dioxygenase-like cupin family protein